MQSPKKLLDQVRDAIRPKHYAYRTEEAHVQRIRHYILFHNKRHPAEIGADKLQAFLIHFAFSDRPSSLPIPHHPLPITHYPSPLTQKTDRL